MAETRSTCPYCGVGCGHAFGGPLRGARERRNLLLLSNHG